MTTGVTDPTGKASVYTKFFPLKSKECEYWLALIYFQETSKVLGKEHINNVISYLIGRTIEENNIIPLYNRVAPGENGSFWLDMSDQYNKAIHITSEGWYVVDNPPILFRRYKHQKPLVVPDENATIKDIWLLFDIINLNKIDGKLDRKACFVLIAMMVCYLIPLIPHPIMLVYGNHGDVKTSTQKAIKSLFDPSCSETLSLSKDPDELQQMLSHSWIPLLDNCSFITSEQSDILSKAVTGAGQRKRALFSDQDDVILNILCCIMINGINVVAQKADLLDRVLMFKANIITAENREKSTIMHQRFDAVKAKILGAFLHLLSASMVKYPNIKTTKLFRLADFHTWGCAVSEVLGESTDFFTEALEEKVLLKTYEAIDASLVGSIVLDYCRSKVSSWPSKIWEVTPQTAFDKLSTFAELRGVKKTKYWPKSPSLFSRKLNEIKSCLAVIGLQIETTRRTKKIISFDATNLKLSDTQDASATVFYCHIQDRVEKCENDEDIASFKILKDEQTFKLCSDCQSKEVKTDSEKEVYWEEKSFEDFTKMLAKKLGES